MPAREQDHSSQRHRTQSTKTTAKAPQHRPQPGPSRNADAQRAEQKEGDSTDEDAEEAEAEEEEEEEEDVRQRTSLSLANNPLPRLDALIETLAQFKNLHRLDLSSIQPSEHNLDGLASLFWLIKSARKSGSEGFKKKLTWLNVSGNPALGKTGAEAWAGLETLEQLFGEPMWTELAFHFLPETLTQLLRPVFRDSPQCISQRALLDPAALARFLFPQSTRALAQ